MFWSTFNKQKLSLDQLRHYIGCLYGLIGDQVEVRGHLQLRTTFTDGVASRTENIRYLMVNTPSAYNILLGRPALNRLMMVGSTRHMKMKLLDLSGKVITIKSDQQEAKRCYENSLKTKSCSWLQSALPTEMGTPVQRSPVQRAPGRGDPSPYGISWRGRLGAERSSLVSHWTKWSKTKLLG